MKNLNIGRKPAKKRWEMHQEHYIC